MLLESQINDRTLLLIDAETVGGIDKGGVVTAHPDKVLGSAVQLIRAIAEELGTAGMVDAAAPPSSMEIAFAVRVDSNAIVSLSRKPDEGQLRVTLRWQLGPEQG